MAKSQTLMQCSPGLPTYSANPSHIRNSSTIFTSLATSSTVSHCDSLNSKAILTQAQRASPQDFASLRTSPHRRKRMSMSTKATLGIYFLKKQGLFLDTFLLTTTRVHSRLEDT